MIVLHSALRPEAVVATLRREVDEEHWSLLSFSGWTGSKAIVGKVDGKRFRLRKRRTVQNDFAHRFYGCVQPEGDGSRIEGYFDFPRWIRYFMRGWLVLAVVIAVPIFALTLSDITSGTHLMGSGSLWVGLVVPPVLLLYALLLPAFGRWLGRGGERFILEFMETTLAATVSSS
jgi:hypothetical protein